MQQQAGQGMAMHLGQGGVRNPCRDIKPNTQGTATWATALPATPYQGGFAFGNAFLEVNSLVGYAGNPAATCVREGSHDAGGMGQRADEGAIDDSPGQHAYEC